MATAAMFVLPIPTFLAYHGNEKRGDLKNVWIPFIKLHDTL
jgi:hypothetical protein